ncbi:hypothetical protein KSF73_03095 [Burkholderiaceae bacterium DAT-1]|nr:hypothetical protein [Burkholderiaceae bacterium DAT-1]
MFSFFKKKDVEPVGHKATKPVVQSATGPITDIPSGGPVSIASSTLGSDMIQVVESGVSEAMESSAICYANEQDDEAIAVLHDDIVAGESRDNVDAWLMLFDLYRLKHRKRDHDELALRFAMLFERTAPVWPMSDTVQAVERAPRQVVPLVMLPTVLSESSIGAPMAQLTDCLSRKQAVRIDVGACSGLDVATSAILLEVLQRLRLARCAVTLIGADSFADVLRGHVEVMRKEPAEQPYWHLLLEILQLSRHLESFENVAVDFAVTYEVSPPSWDEGMAVPDAKAATVSDTPVAKSSEPEAVVDAFRFSNAISAATDATFAPLLAFGKAHPLVRIDFSHVSRIDFVSCGLFMNALFTLVAEGREIEIFRANEPVIALFRIIGVTDVASVIRPKI